MLLHQVQRLKNLRTKFRFVCEGLGGSKWAEVTCVFDVEKSWWGLEYMCVFITLE